MAIASILVGIVSGILSFFGALIAGQGFLLAVGLYVIGGLLGMGVTFAIVALRSLQQPANADADMGLVTAQA